MTAEEQPLVPGTVRVDGQPRLPRRSPQTRIGLPTFFDSSAGHWVHLKTSNPIVILSFHVSQGCDLRRPVVDSVADGTLAA